MKKQYFQFKCTAIYYQLKLAHFIEVELSEDVRGADKLLYYVGYGVGSAIRELNEFGTWLGGEIYDIVNE